MTRPKHSRQRHETTSARGPHRVPGRHDGARQPPPGTPDLRIRRPAREEREQVRAERDPRSATRKTRATKPAPRTPGINAKTASSMRPRHGESTAREAAGSDRRGEPTARPADEETGAAERSDQAPRARQRDTAIETATCDPTQRTKITWPEGRSRRAKAPTTPSADRGRKRRARSAATSSLTRTPTRGQAVPDTAGAMARRAAERPPARRRTTRWTAQPVTQYEPGNAIRKGAASNAGASPVTATETLARRAPKTAAERPRRIHKRRQSKTSD